MEQKYVLGVDPGTGSLGLVVRDTETEELMKQVKFASVDIVRSGVIESGQKVLVTKQTDIINAPTAAERPRD